VPWSTTDSTLFPRAYYRDADGDGNLDRDSQGRVTVERLDLVRRRWVKNRHYGWVPRLRIEHPGGALTVGGELRAHDGRHVGSVIGGSGLPPATGPDHVYYDYHPRTFAAGLFAREEWRLRPRVTATADLAWRHQGYSMQGDQFDGVQFDQAYDFALPRLGVRWSMRDDAAMFLAVAQSHREPAFRDLYDGEGMGNVPLIVGGEPLIRPENVMDYEAGFEWGHSGLAATANLFRMDFRDELVYAGQFDIDLGYPILGNAARSVHQGIELAVTASNRTPAGTGAAPEPGPRRGPEIVASASAALGDNHFVEYQEIYGTAPTDIVSYDGKAIGFFPAVMGNLSAHANWPRASLGFDLRYAGRIYVDNTESKDASAAPRTVLDADASYRLAVPGAGRVEFRARVLNAFDRRYETGGYMDYDAGGSLVPHLIPAAARQVMGELRLEF
jgi:iron complex outermembrane receptor protein